MAGVNKVILLGNLGADPEVKHLESGSVVARISLATSESYKDKDGNKVDTTEWHDIEMWEGLAKVAEKYLKQGDTIYVEGKIKSNKWTDDEGNNRKTMRIRAFNMTMVKRKNSGEQQPEQKETQTDSNPYKEKYEELKVDPLASPKASASADIDDLPF